MHAANGYLIDEFLRDGSNHRTDPYGGAIENRVRLLREVTDAVAGVAGPERTGVRLSPNGAIQGTNDSNPEPLFVAAAQALTSTVHGLELGAAGRDMPGTITAALLPSFAQLFGIFARERPLGAACARRAAEAEGLPAPLPDPAKAERRKAGSAALEQPQRRQGASEPGPRLR